MDELPKLTLRQKRFLKYYLEDPDNKAAAARKAGYSPKNASKLACEVLRSPRMIPYLELAAETGEMPTVDLNESDIKGKLAQIAEVNIFDILDVENGRALIFKELSDIPYELGQAIKKLKETPQGIEVEFFDKMKAIDIICKLKNLYSNEVDVNLTQPVSVQYAKDAD